MTDRTLQLVSTLARNIESVRRLPRLRVAGAAIALLSLAVAGGVAALRVLLGGAPLIDMTPLRAAIAVCLLGIFAGGLTYGLASSIPGRQSVQRAGMGLLCAGLGLGLLSVFGMVLTGKGMGSVSLAWLPPTLACLSSASFFALMPAAAVAAFVLRAAPFRPSLSLAIGIGGAVGLGAALVHVNCSGKDALHVLVSHVGAPLLVGLLMWLGARVSMLVAGRTG